MKKALDQTVRDLKREVNKKVLKVPSIEQKTLDATSNEPWGPRGSLMAEISQASCNYNDYQLIMAVLWKRIQDTGKNWRHVYKALSVLEYLVIYGSERVIDETREHAYQISTLSDFLYTDSNGRDQGSNVRKKSQTLVALVNNKERLQEVRHKALSNKDKVSRPPLSSSARYNDVHFEGGNREDGIVRERNLALRDKDRYHNGGDKYIQARNPYVKDKDEFNSSDDNYRIRANDDYQYRLRSQSVDGYTKNSFDDYDRHSTRSDGGRDGEILHDERIDAPPSYEVVTNDFCADVQNDKGAATASMQRASSPSRPKETSKGTNQTPGSVAAQSAQAHEIEVASFDEFDPRGSVSAAPTVASSGLELDIFGLSAVDYTDSSASLIVTSTAIPDDDVLTNSGLCANFIVASTAHAVPSEPDKNPFGDAPFKAVPREESPSETNTSASATSQASSGFVSVAEIILPVEKRMEAAQSYDFGNTSGEPIYAPDVANVQHFLANRNSYASEVSAANSSKDILDGILPWTGPVPPVPAYSASDAHNSSETGPADLQIGQINPFEQPELSNHQAGQVNPFEFQAFQPINANQMNSTENSVLPIPQTSPRAPLSSHTLQPASLNGMQSSQMISMDKHGISHLHSSQSTVPADHQKFQTNLSQQHNHSFQSFALLSMIPFQAVHSTVPGNVHLESAQLNPSQPVTAPAPQSSLGVPVSSQPFQSSPTIIQSPQINLHPFRPAASTSLQEARQAAPSTIQTSQLSFTPHSALPDLLISSHGSAKLQPSNKKFEPKSVVWADTISRGLVNLNISGPKTNPLADIGIDFDDINRKEKRNEAKSSQPPLPSSSSMGKAMGSGSGLGRAGTGAFIQPLNPTMGMSMSMGMGMGMNQPYIGMGMGGNMGMMHPSSGMPQQGPGIPGAYNNTMNARGGYGQHHQS